MVGVGMLMLLLGVWSGLARWRGKLFEWTWLHRAAVAMGPAGFLAVLCGWITTEVGRQPYTVYGLLRTADSASALRADAVGYSLTAFVIIYFFVFGSGTFYVLRLMSRTPDEHIDIRQIGPTRTAGITPIAQAGE